MPRRPLARIGLLLAALVALVALAPSLARPPAAARAQAVDHEQCRPDGLYRTPGLAVPYCSVYDSAGRELMGADHPRRIIGYFTSWRHGKNGAPAYLVSDIPWGKLTHINYAFAHVGADNRISVGDVSDPNNPSTGMSWPGVPGAELDPGLPYRGHFNLLTRYKRLHPGVKTLISVGGWAETGGYFAADGGRVDSGGFYTMTTTASGAVNSAGISAFADSVVAFLRAYGFDGVDIDYEYPTSMNDAGNPLDWPIANPRRGALNAGYVALMRTLRERLDAASVADGRHYMLTVAAPSSGYLLRGMEAFQVAPYLDYINIMSYDLHGAWNEFVGPNAALYDNGDDAELARWNVYGTSQYGGIGYLNTDWSYHYFRGAVPAGRINIGVPYYTRGWKNVSGGTDGLWGRAVGSNCPSGLTSCGDGARGIDNLWHDLEGGEELGAGSNPMWHAKNLEAGILPSYLGAYGLDPAADPEDRLVGSYVRRYSAAHVAPWLWNAEKRVFLSTEDEQSVAAKADYVAERGIGGVMFWELAGDYAYDQARRGGQGEYFMGDTLTSRFYERFRSAGPYGASTSAGPLPAQTIDVQVELTEFALGDSNFPISPKLKITNRSAQTIPGGAEFQFDYPTSAPGTMADQSGAGLRTVSVGHSGPNIGGLDGDMHRAAFTLPAWQSIPPGGSITVQLVYYLPIAGPSNFTLSFGGASYRLPGDYGRGAGPGGPSPTPTAPGATATATRTATPTAPGATATATLTATASPSPTSAGACSAPAWSATATYTGGSVVSHAGRQWRAKWWTQGEEPGTTGQYGVWEDQGACGGGPAATATRTATPSPTAPGASATATRTATATAQATATRTATPSPTGQSGAPAWAPGVAYRVGDLASYAGVTYRCLQAHTSLAGWEPPNVPALWAP